MLRAFLFSVVFAAAISICFPQLRAEDKSPSFAFKWSGYIKADFSYDDTRVYPGNYALFVSAPESPDAAKNSFTNITARETRLGFDFAWPEGEIKTAAKIEFDFYGLGAASASLTRQRPC